MSGLATTDIEIFKNGSATQRSSDNGYTLLDTDGTDIDGITGFQGISVNLADNSDAGFYAAGGDFVVVIASITVDTQTVNFVAARFSIGYPATILDTTIATLSTQTSFTLTAGPAEDDALNGCLVIIHDVASAVQAGSAQVADYTGSTKTVTLVAGTTFTAAATDNISFFTPALLPTVTGRTLDVSTGGEAGVDWANVGTPGSTVGLSATTVATVTTTTTATNVTTVNGLAAGVITAASIAADAITAAKVADGTIDAATFAAGAINAAAIASDAITAAKIADNAIDTATFAAGTTIPRVTLADTLTTYTGNTPQTGDSFARIGVAGAGLTNIDLPNQTFDLVGNITGNLSGSVGSVTGAVGSVTGAVGSVTGNVGGNVVGTVASVVGNLGGNVVGNVNGNVVGSVGSVVGAVGSVTGAVGSVTGSVGGNVTGSVGSLAAQAKADVNAEVVDGLSVDTYAEPAAVPAATASLASKIGWFSSLSRNKRLTTAVLDTLRNDADSGSIATATLSDDGTTFTRTEYS